MGFQSCNAGRAADRMQTVDDVSMRCARLLYDTVIYLVLNARRRAMRSGGRHAICLSACCMRSSGVECPFGITTTYVLLIQTNPRQARKHAVAWNDEVVIEASISGGPNPNFGTPPCQGWPILKIPILICCRHPIVHRYRRVSFLPRFWASPAMPHEVARLSPGVYPPVTYTPPSHVLAQ